MDKKFEQLLVAYVNASDSEERVRIGQTLWKEFGHKKAVLVMDMSGFSLLTQKFGIVHYLSMVKRMQITTRPIIEQNGGQVVKFEADNCFAMFDDVLASMRAAVELNVAFDKMNGHTDESFDIRVSIGIDYGAVLLIGGPDYFGDAVNRACKLGEDVAGPGEIYVNQAAFELVPAQAGFHGKPLELSISGVHLKAVMLEGF
jgi:class 3 adenylate cyclase